MQTVSSHHNQLVIGSDVTDRKRTEEAVRETKEFGIPEALDSGNPESFELRLVTMLAEDQLGGKVELDRTEGTRFEIRFGVME
jgi:two-component sensor histidine kinase